MDQCCHVFYYSSHYQIFILSLAVHHPLTLLLSSWITLNFLEQTADHRFALGFLRSGDGPESYCPAQRRLADRGAGVGGSGGFQGLTTSPPLIAPLKWRR